MQQDRPQTAKSTLELGDFTKESLTEEGLASTGDEIVPELNFTTTASPTEMSTSEGEKP